MNKADKETKRITTFAENQRYIRPLLALAKASPGIVKYGYDEKTYRMNVRYIGMYVQFYLHTNMLVVQAGNNGTYKTEWPLQRFIHRLEQGRMGFEKGK